MTAQTSHPVHENRIRPDIRSMLEIHILEALPLREACRRAGVRYTKNASQAKFTKSGKAYVEELRRRRKVVLEFGVDEPCLATLMELRDTARKAGSFVASVRAHETGNVDGRHSKVCKAFCNPRVSSPGGPARRQRTHGQL